MPERFPLSRIGNCELLRELGRGCMGVVFEARDLDSGHIVAIKILPWRISIVPEQVDRFEREARIASRLRHRNIVPVFRFGQEQGYCYYVMQLVDGVGLDQIIERLQQPDGLVDVEEIRKIHRDAEPSPNALSQSPGESAAELSDSDPPRRRVLTSTSWQGFARIAAQAAQALSAAHAAGVLHNDIKPGNLLLDASGHVWVSDFGLSRASDESGSPEFAGSISGTLRYMAPERLHGEQSPASDVYSLGATLYELCLQRPVFAVLDRELLAQCIRVDRPTAPRQICPGFPRALEQIILNCLEKQTADRYPSADAMLTDLLRFSKGLPVRSRRRSAVRRILDWLKGRWSRLRTADKSR